MVQPNSHYETNFLLGQNALESGNAQLANNYWQACAEHLPRNLEAIRQLAHAFKSIGQLTKAEQLLNIGNQEVPGNPLLQADLAGILLDRGQSYTASQQFIALARQAEQKGATVEALSLLSNALMALEYSSIETSAQKKSIAEHWNQLATQWAKVLISNEQIPNWIQKPNTDEPLRIGFISGDLCDHPVGFLLLPLLQNQQPSAWTPYVYDNKSRQDNTNKQLRQTIPGGQWQGIGELNDAQAMRAILNDHLDILIDLSGHTGKTRLRIMVHRLAGKQLSWLGFSGTTGLSSIDGVILDDILGKDAQPQFCEPILELNPSRFCFRPPFAPALQPPPSLKNGFITFGCFNNTAKYNTAVLDTWVHILQQTPNSRLILKWRTFADSNFRNEILAPFVKAGIDAERVEFRAFSTHRQMLDEYNDVDIALDTHPFNGGYTSLEALWMGLPLITLAGSSPISRQTASFLNAIGHHDWIANSPENFRQIVLKLVQDLDKLAEIRRQLRYQVMDSPIFNATRFADVFQELLFTEINTPQD